MSALISRKKRLQGMIKVKTAKINELTGDIMKLQDKINRIQIKLDNLEEAKRKRCRHNGETKKEYNARSDASFKFFIFCAECGAWIGKQDFNGAVSFYDKAII